MTCPVCGAPVTAISSDEGTNAVVYDAGGHPSRRSEYELRQRRRAQDEEDRAFRVDALCRDAISVAEHLLGYAPRHERARHYQALTELLSAVNAEMRPVPGPKRPQSDDQSP